MPRRLALLVTVLALGVGACSTTPALSAKDIINKSLLAMQGVKTAHVQADVTGKVSVNLTGAGSGSQLDIGGTTAAADIDVPGKKTKLTFAVPALLGTSGELIAADNAIYLKLGGLFGSGDKYTKLAAPNLGSSGSTVTDPTKALADLQAGLDKLSTPPSTGADEKCGDADCYHVIVKFTGEDLNRLGSPSPLASPTNGNINLDLFVRKNDFRLGRLVVAASDATTGNVNVTTAFTYDMPVAIQAPSPDQVTEGGLPFPIPSLTAP
jgi:hypothetical protein